MFFYFFIIDIVYKYNYITLKNRNHRIGIPFVGWGRDIPTHASVIVVCLDGIGEREANGHSVITLQSSYFVDFGIIFTTLTLQLSHKPHTLYNVMEYGQMSWNTLIIQ